MRHATITTWANGFGQWRARVEFPHTLSENDPRPEYNLHHHWANLRRKARTAIINELVQREQKTNETREAAVSRIRQALPNLHVIDQGLTAQNTWTSVTFGE